MGKVVFHAVVMALFVGALACGTARGDENYWKATTATDGEYLASNGANWSAGHAPLVSETVVFDGDFSTLDCTWDAAAPKTVAGWAQSNGYTNSVIFKTTFSDSAFTISGNASIESGRWTLPTATSEQTSPLYRIKVFVGGTLSVASGASINVSGKAPWATESGGAYGGSCDSTQAYGNVLEPSDPGHTWPTSRKTVPPSGAASCRAT